MANVFISYAREDRGFVDLLGKALGAAGLDVWFDRNLDAGAFRDQIVSELEHAEAAIVVWSARSRQSRYVLDESERAAKRGVLLPVRIDDTEVPLGFGALQTLDLSSWSGRADDPRFKWVLDQIDRIRKNATPLAARPIVPFVGRSLVLALILAAICSPVLALLNAAKLGFSGSVTLVRSVGEAFVLSATCIIPVLLWCGFETRQFGLSRPGPIVQRATGIYGISAVVALAITATATLAGVTAGLSLTAAVAQLCFVALLLTLVLGGLIAIFKATASMIGRLRGR
jgi:TIR domain